MGHRGAARGQDRLGRDRPLTGPIEVLRDALGVPHCYARSERDAFFAQGWAHARDRLWQMEYDRRRGVGRWAEVVGGRGIRSDVFYRRVDLSASVHRDVDALAPATREMLDAYAEGVNAGIGSAPLPREFAATGVVPEPWEPWHSVLVFRVRHLLMGSARSKLWRAVVGDTLGAEVARSMIAGAGEEHLACVPPGQACADSSATLATSATGWGDAVGGSNSWVLAGSRTASGLPLLAGDPHREFEVPNVYVQGHIACDAWDVLGIGLPGVPGFSHFGHNKDVAWSITHAMADDQDLFRVDAAAALSRRVEVIEVRDGEPVEVEVVHTERGPMIGEGLALCWTATAETNLGFDAMRPMLGARTVDELFDLMDVWVEPANSVLAADVRGSIGYLTRGRLPRRLRPDGAWIPVPDEAAFHWQGWVPFEDLPRAVDPDGDFLFSANNRIAASPDAPYIGIDVAAPGRARRIVATLRDVKGATVDDMAALHRDVVSLAATRLLEHLAEWAPVAGWDGAMAPDSSAAAAYSVLRRELLLIVLDRSGLGAVLDSPVNRLLPGVVPESVLWRTVSQHLEADDVSLLGESTWDDVLAEAKARTAEVWHGETWGELHTLTPRHPLLADGFDPPAVPYGGDMDTVQAASYVPTLSLATKAGSVARYAFDVADWDRSGWVLPLGASGEPGTPHFADQQESWRTGVLQPALYSRAAVEAAAAERITIG